MNFFIFIFLRVLNAQECEENTVIGVSCKKYRLCLGGKMRTVHCNEGLVHDGSAPGCVEESELPAGLDCGPAVLAAEPATQRVATNVAKLGCAENTVEAVSCGKYRLCLGGRMRLVHCNAGLVHDGVSTQCVAPSTLSDSPCAPVVPSPASCVEDAISAKTCATFHRCINGQKRLVHCNPGMVHDGFSLECATPETLACGSLCGLACPTIAPVCGEGSARSIGTCSHFDTCNNGQWKRASCNPGLVFDENGPCVTPASLACGSPCGLPCPVVVEISECGEGSFRSRDSCTHFDTCHDGKWQTATCNPGLVFSVNGICVAPVTLACGSYCGFACPTVEPECIEGAVMAVNCNEFKYCVDGQWRNSFCNEGLVHAMGYDAVCVLPSTLLCDSECGFACAPAITEIADQICNPHEVRVVNCNSYEYCSSDGTEWHQNHCSSDYVYIELVGICLPKSIITSDHECGYLADPIECPEAVCPITECPACPHIVEYECPCETIDAVIVDLKSSIGLLFDQAGECQM